MNLSLIRGAPPRTRRSGFTLIELLVVIAIISILASILFPIFARARENARRASCQSNLKQIGLGIQQYTQDYDEKYLPAQTDSGATFVTTLQPYMKSTQVFVCPSGAQATSDDVTAANLTATDYRWEAFGDTGHYGLNDQVTASAPVVSLAEVTQPAETPAAFDASWYEASDFLNSNGSIWDAKRHFDGVNIAYADGHVKWQGTNRFGTINIYP